MKGSILLLEDEQSVNRGVSFTLEKAGYQVYACGSINEAEHMLKAHHPQMLICDLTLPDGSGLDFIKKIHRTGRVCGGRGEIRFREEHAFTYAKKTFFGGLDYPTEGKVYVGDMDIFSLKEDALAVFRRRKMGFVFQAFNLVSSINVWENIVLPIGLDGKKADTAFVKDIVNTLGLNSKIHNMPNTLSGGQQQRVAIARALASRPDIVFADEPTGNLDSKTSDEVIGLMKMSAQKYGQTLVMIMHDEDIAQLADRIIVIEDGKVGEMR